MNPTRVICPTLSNPQAYVDDENTPRQECVLKVKGLMPNSIVGTHFVFSAAKHLGGT